VAGNALYVYGGHRGEAHVYSKENHSRHFVRVDLTKMDKWEELPFRVPLQGFGMAAYGGKIYLAGGSQATNEPGTRSNLTSVANVSVFDPASKTWSRLTPLPAPRSSHELLVEDGKLYVVGGWSMANGKGVEWFDHSLMADLSKKTLEWEKIPHPHWRVRAHSSVILDSRLFVIGGLDENGTTDAVEVLDLKTRRWEKVPDYPSVNSLKAFGSAACVSEGRVVACSYSYQPRILDESNSSWRATQAKVKEKRFFHRMIARQSGEVLFLGGANHDGHLDSIEVLNFSDDSVPQSEKTNKQTEPNSRGSEWRGFRGNGNSHSFAESLPLNWSDENNLRWRKKLPGYGQSTPVVWKDRVFSTSTEGDFSEKLLVHCNKLSTGESLWRKSYPSPVKIKRSQYVSQAAPSPVVDERAVYLFFESGQLLALDHQGKELWKRSLTDEYGPMQGNHGIGSSLFQSGKALGLLVDHSGPSYLLRIDKKTGQSIWKKDRPERVSWSTPTLCESGEEETVFISSNGIVESYDFLAGKRLWKREGIEGNTVASPSFTDDLTIIGSSTPGQSMALSRKGRTNEGGKLLWVAEDGSSSFGSPLVTDNHLYLVNRAGVVTCHGLKDGGKKWNLRLPGPCWASPMKTLGRVYFFTKDGATIVLKDDGSKEVLAENKLSIEVRVYGVASINRAFVIRTGTELICVGHEASTE
jgi:outer membrane protein assembly factor BamB